MGRIGEPATVMQGRSGVRSALILAATLGLTASAEPGLRYVRAAALLLSVIGAADPSGVTELLKQPVSERESRVALPGRTLRARVYTPTRGPIRSRAMLLHGVHPQGVDEPRLQAFARALASVGIETTTPQLAELAEQRVLPRTIEDIGACAIALAEQNGGEPLGAFGISFAGGLLLLAATESSVGNALSYAVTVGAHHDLRRVLRYYAGETVRAPDGSSADVQAHPYGGRVMAAAYAELFFERADVDLARRALRDWLDGRYSQARGALPKLSAAGRDRFAIVTDNARRRELGALLLRAAAEREADLLAVSPASGLASLRVPSFLVHGASDPIVPSLETRWLAREVPRSALRAALVTPVLRHAELSSPPGTRENLKIVRFVATFLAASRPQRSLERR